MDLTDCGCRRGGGVEPSPECHSYGLCRMRATAPASARRPAEDAMTANKAEKTGPERIREAIARDRGHFAPNHPVTLCGRPDGTEVRADVQPIQEIHVSLGERVAGLVQCPSCLGLRFGPVHLLKRLLVGKH